MDQILEVEEEVELQQQEQLVHLQLEDQEEQVLLI
jgi:hypothetical protein